MPSSPFIAALASVGGFSDSESSPVRSMATLMATVQSFNGASSNCTENRSACMYGYQQGGSGAMVYFVARVCMLALLVVSASYPFIRFVKIHREKSSRFIAGSNGAGAGTATASRCWFIFDAQLQVMILLGLCQSWLCLYWVDPLDIEVTHLRTPTPTPTASFLNALLFGHRACFQIR